MVLFRTHINLNPSCLKRMSQPECVTDVFFGVPSASDNLSEQQLSRVCLVTMLVMNFAQARARWRDLLPTSCAVIWCGRSQAPGSSSFPSVWRPFPPSTPQAHSSVVSRAKGFRNHCAKQVLSCDNGSAGCWENISPGVAENK